MYSKMICLYIYMHMYIIFPYFPLWFIILNVDIEYTIYPVVFSRRTFLFTNSMYNSLHCSPHSQFIAPARLTTTSLLYLWVCFFELNFLNHVFIFSWVAVVKKTLWVFLIIIILIHIIVWYPIWQCGFLYWYNRFFSMFLWAWCGRNKCLCDPCWMDINLQF